MPVVQSLLSNFPRPAEAVLTDLNIVLHGGPHDGEERTLPRGVEQITFGEHCEPHWSIYDSYDRTCMVDFTSGRTVFFHKTHALRLCPREGWLRRAISFLYNWEL